jgi:hypothetical protein
MNFGGGEKAQKFGNGTLATDYCGERRRVCASHTPTDICEGFHVKETGPVIYLCVCFSSSLF